MKSKHESPNLKSQMASLSEGMMGAMAPLLVGANIPSDEARAWDDYAKHTLTALLANYTTSEETAGDVERDANVLCKMATTFADKLLEARRERFNAETYRKHLTELLAPMMSTCGQPIGPMRCALAQDHEGEHSAVAVNEKSEHP